MTRRRPSNRSAAQGPRLDYHDPTAGWGGAPPAASALTLRLLLAGFGVVTCAAGAVASAVVGAPSAFTVTLVVLAVFAALDVTVVIRRKRRGEPG